MKKTLFLILISTVLVSGCLTKEKLPEKKTPVEKKLPVEITEVSKAPVFSTSELKEKIRTTLELNYRTSEKQEDLKVATDILNLEPINENYYIWVTIMKNSDTPKYRLETVKINDKNEIESIKSVEEAKIKSNKKLLNEYPEEIVQRVEAKL